MYTDLYNIMVEELFLAIIPAIAVLMGIVAIKGFGILPSIHRFLWDIFWVLFILAFASAYGKAVGVYLPTVIFTFLVYLVLRIKPIRKWLFGSWLKGIITVVVILGYYIVVFFI